jgi:ElaB/YqjD/DUF883 family membrane-anchored ribosome-binding protein
MEDQAELIRQQMQETRADLSEKLQALGGLLPSTETVTETVGSVTETAASVADNVEETVKSVQGALDLPKQVQEHPWLAVGGAVVVGYLAHGYFTARGTDGKGSSLFASQIQGLEQFAARTAFDVIGGLVAGASAGQTGSLLQTIVGQFLNGQSNTPATPQGGRSQNGTSGPRESGSRRPTASSIN